MHAMLTLCCIWQQSGGSIEKMAALEGSGAAGAGAPGVAGVGGGTTNSGSGGGGGNRSTITISRKLHTLEERLKAEHDTTSSSSSTTPHNNNITSSPSNIPGTVTVHHRKTTPTLSLNNQRRHMELKVRNTQAPSDPVHTERLRRIRRVLTVDGVEYSSDVKDMTRLGELGSGTCGQVTKMLHKPSKSIIAVKQMRKSNNSEEVKRILMDLEIVLRSHSCPYIVKCLGCVITEDEVWICMELMASCFDKILKRLNGPIPENILGKVTLATVKALSYLKDKHEVIHRDVKPSNILIDEKGVVKLCDFGISGWLVDSKAKTRNAGCAAYMAPERIDPPNPQEPDYDIRADVWSLGITLVELATGNFPYKDCHNDFEVLSKVIGEEPPALPDSDKFSPEFKAFVQQCLTKNFEHRPKYAALLEHPFLQKAEASDVNVAEWLSEVLPPSSPQRTTAPLITFPTPTLDNQAILNKDKSLNKTTQLEHSNVEKSICQETAIINITDDSTPKINSDVVDLGVGDSLNRMQMDDSDVGSIKADSSMTSLESSIGNKPAEIPPRTPRFVRANPEYSSLNSYIKPNQMPYNRDYYVQPPPPRNRSYSNTMVYGSNGTEKYLPAKFISSSPNTKNYFANLDVRNQPFSGGGPSSLEGVVNPVYGRDHSEYMKHYRSPEVARRQYFSPTRKQELHHRNVVSPPNFAVNYEDNNGTFSPPQFRPNGPTSYFNPPCPVSRFAPNSVGGGYHHNPGGSCSQPASLETYDENRPYPHHRLNDKCYSPALWSPQPVARRTLHIKERDDKDYRRTVESPHHHHLQGNTSPIVLQRFYHQQSQRRSRRDVRDGSPHHRTSVSRDASIGRSPEPPRRAHRDPSLGRNNTPPHNMEQLLRERCERERLSIETCRIPDGETYLNTHPDLIKTHAPRYETSNNSPMQQSNVNLMKDRFEMRSWNDKPEQNNADIVPDRSRTHERFEPRLGHLRQPSEDSKDGKSSRKNGEKINGDVKDKEKTRMSPLVLRKKSHSKDKDEQGWLNSIAGMVKKRFTSYLKLHLGSTNSVAHHHHHHRSSPLHLGPGSSPVTRSTRITNNVGDSILRNGGEEIDSPSIGKPRMQECSYNYVPGFRYGGVPQPPPRRMAESWSLPGSPLPARPT